MTFKIEQKVKGTLARAGVIVTPHGNMNTPLFVAVATQASVKSLTVEETASAGLEAVLCNTYHLYLKPGHDIVKQAGGIHRFMNWSGPIMTDSGGFQVFSLGAAFDKSVGKIAGKSSSKEKEIAGGDDESIKAKPNLVKIDEEGVDFKSVVDGSSHRFTPEKSIEIQNAIGADIIFAFDECPSPHAAAGYQREALDRTLRWAKRSMDRHNLFKTKGAGRQALFGIVQGGRVEELRRLSAKETAKIDFDGFGIGGSFDKEDIGKAVRWVNEHLPPEKPRHLLGIGEPRDLVEAILNGCDTFDCVAPTRVARNGAVYTKEGRINILNSQYKSDFRPIDEDCKCYTCISYTRAYVSHLFRAGEMLAATLASIHNLFFISDLMREARTSILDGVFESWTEEFRRRTRKL